MINKLCDFDSKEESNRILKAIESFLREKRREIILMGGNYEDVRKETEEVIIKYMTSVPKVSM